MHLSVNEVRGGAVPRGVIEGDLGERDLSQLLDGRHGRPLSPTKHENLAGELLGQPVGAH